MRIDYPLPAQTQALRELWKEAFGDTDAYLDLFFGSGYAPTRCRCISEGEKLAAALYWLDMTCHGQRIAYIYAVATGRAFRGRGLCRALMEDTHRVLKGRGYAGAVLSPGDAGLARMYGTMGYSHCGGISQLRCQAGTVPAALRRVDGITYQKKRNELLPPGGVGLEKAALRFLEAQAELYVGTETALAAIRTEKGLLGIELLGDTACASGILTKLGCQEGVFRIPGDDHPFAMFCPLKDRAKAPEYLGIAFD